MSSSVFFQVEKTIVYSSDSLFKVNFTKVGVGCFLVG